MTSLIYNADGGRAIMKRYLPGERFAKKRIHSESVARFCGNAARLINKSLYTMKVDVGLAEWVGMVHDIGQGVRIREHELETAEILREMQVPDRIVRQTMHGWLWEQSGGDLDYEQIKGNPDYLPSGPIGPILNYADALIALDRPIGIEKRIDGVIERIGDANCSEEWKRSCIEAAEKSKRRFKLYESDVLRLTKIEEDIWRESPLGLVKGNEKSYEAIWNYDFG